MIICSLLSFVFVSCGGSGLTSAPSAAPVSAYAPSPKPLKSERKVQKSGSMEMKTRKLKASAEKSLKLAEQYRSRVLRTSLTADEFRAQVQVPAASLEGLMESLKDVGKVESSEVRLADVTEAYRDLAAALKNQRALRDRLRALLSRATKVKDVLKIEAELNRVQTELDQMEARLRAMESQVSYSTLRLSIERERIPGPIGLVSKSVGKLVSLN